MVFFTELPRSLRAKVNALIEDMRGTDTFWVSFDTNGRPKDVHRMSGYSLSEFAEGAWQRYKDGWERILV